VLFRSRQRNDEANQTQAQFDADDNMLSFGADSYIYDSRNRLIANGSNVSYGYDSQNHRVSQTNNGNTTTYTINPNASLSELLEMTESNGDRTIYTYGRGLLSQEKNGKTKILDNFSGKISETKKEPMVCIDLIVKTMKGLGFEKILEFSNGEKIIDGGKTENA